MTEATKAPMCQKPGCRMMAQSNSDYCEEYHSDLEPAAPGPTETVPASRLLAVEAELGALRELEHMVRTDLAVRRFLSPPLDKLDALRAAPPSHPVAPEPAQEAGGALRGSVQAELIQLMRDVCDELELPEEKGERAPILEALNVAHNKGAECARSVHRTDHNDTHAEIRSMGLQLAKASYPNWGPRIVAYVYQQEQSEREAADLRDLAALRLRDNVTLQSDRDAERTQKEAALLEVSRLSFELGKAQGEAEGHALVRKGVEAEREALRVELKETRSQFDKWQTAMRAENEVLKAKLELFKLGAQPAEAATAPILPLCSRCGAIDGQCAAMGCLTAAEQAEAAPAAKLECPRNCEGGTRTDPRDHAVNCPKSEPVAKAEAPSGPAVKDYCLDCRSTEPSVRYMSCDNPWHRPNPNTVPEMVIAPSEPAGWVPKPGDVVRFKDTPTNAWDYTVIRYDASDDTVEVRCNDGHQATSGWHKRTDLEPAPQSPAGGEKSCPTKGCVLPSDHSTDHDFDRPVMMGELVAALVASGNEGMKWLARELEGLEH